MPTTGTSKTTKAASKKLNATEVKLLAKCIADYHSGFEKMAEALAIIRRQKLYRENFDTFEAFVQAEFGLDRRAGIRYADAHDSLQNLEKAKTNVRPANMGVTTQLEGLTAEQQVKAWDKAVSELKTGEKVTAKHLKAVVESQNKGLAQKRKAKKAAKKGARTTPNKSSVTDETLINELNKRGAELAGKGANIIPMPKEEDTKAQSTDSLLAKVKLLMDEYAKWHKAELVSTKVSEYAKKWFADKHTSVAKSGGRVG